MDLKQNKLTKLEWESIEIPESQKEKMILRMIIDGYDASNIYMNQTSSMLSLLKIEPGSIDYFNCIETYIFNTYFANTVDKIKKKFNKDSKEFTFLETIKPKSKLEVKRGDKIRFQQNASTECFETILLEELDSFTTTFNELHYFTIYVLLKNRIKNINKFVLNIVNYFLEEYEISMKKIVFQSNEFIEKNVILSKYTDITLYEHQKQLFFYSKKEGPKLIFYIAPTGTGKTLTPLALSKKYKIIFVCAARHVGLSMAKACITMGKKIAFAFGCQTPEDIRLHYAAAKDYVKDRKSGGIYKVDNSVGDNVEIIISDIQSYLCSMYYMSAFNKPEDMIMYWDEPTISLDYDDHPLHTMIQKNWKDNTIPNIILSSATLPRVNEIGDAIQDFIGKFNGEIYTAESYDNKKTIPLFDMNGSVILPHLLTRDYDKLQEIVSQCLNNLSILRYFELNQVALFIKFIEDMGYIHARHFAERQFTCIDDINVKNIKLHYLKLLQVIDRKHWEAIYDSQIKKGVKHSALIATSDAHTLTDGPTIYLTEDVKKIAQFCIQQVDIPEKVMDDIMKVIGFNDEVNIKIGILERKMEDIENKGTDKKKEISEEVVDNIKGLSSVRQELAMTQQLIKPIFLNNIFIPNKREHLKKWATDIKGSPFTSDIDEVTVVKIMSLPIDCSWKVLLLIGIGVFSNDADTNYTEIMKQLAVEQKLFLIIASSDYIYGTNYQFCHGYIGKDLIVTQDKILQALGRIGRNSTNSDYSIRFRNQEHIDNLFYSRQRPEVLNMNRLFS
jgi:hypothetical protein